jgi:hypothetical protein
MHGKGVMRLTHTRVEKCGQRGIQAKYCVHLHRAKECKDCLVKGNAVEFSHQRGIVVHDTHLSTVEENVLNDVRGANYYIEDGNEMYAQKDAEETRGERWPLCGYVLCAVLLLPILLCCCVLTHINTMVHVLP